MKNRDMYSSLRGTLEKLSFPRGKAPLPLSGSEIKKKQAVAITEDCLARAAVIAKATDSFGGTLVPEGRARLRYFALTQFDAIDDGRRPEECAELVAKEAEAAGVRFIDAERAGFVKLVETQISEAMPAS